MGLLELLKKTFDNKSFVDLSGKNRDLSVEDHLTTLVPRPESKVYKLANKVLNDFYFVESEKFLNDSVREINFKDRRAHMAIKLSLNSEQSKAFEYLCPDVKPIVMGHVLLAPATEPKLRMTVSLAIIFAFYNKSAQQISSDIYKLAKFKS